MAKLPWFPFYGRDFHTDEKVKGFNFRQRGFYLFLLSHQWEHGSVPSWDECWIFQEVQGELNVVRTEWAPHDDSPCLSTTEAAVSRAEEELQAVFVSCFVPSPTQKGRFINPRLEAVRVEIMEKEERKREAASKGGQAKRDKQKQCLSSAEAVPGQCSGNAIQNQIQIQKKKKDEEKKSSPNGADKESAAAAAKLTWKDLVERWNQIPGVQKSNVQLLKGTKLPDLINTRLHDHPDPSWWTELFEIVSRSPFLCGKVKPAKGKKLFRASLYWALGVENLTKVLSEQYVDHGSGGAHDIDAEWGQTGKFAESFKNWGNEPEAVVADGGPGAGDAGGA